MKMVTVCMLSLCLMSVLNASEEEFPSKATIISRFQDPYHAERIKSIDCLGLINVSLEALKAFLSTNAELIAAEICDSERLSDEAAYADVVSIVLYLHFAKAFGVPMALKEEVADDPYCLLNAVKYGNVDLVRMQISGGANINVRDSSGATPLHWACARGAYKMVQVLVDAGAEVQAVTYSAKKTPLHFLGGAHSLQSVKSMNSLYACASGDSVKYTAFDPVKALQILVLNGANPQARDVAGKRPYDTVRLDREGCRGESESSVAFGRMLDSMSAPDSSEALYRETLRRATGEPASSPVSTSTEDTVGGGGAGAAMTEGREERCTIS